MLQLRLERFDIRRGHRLGRLQLTQRERAILGTFPQLFFTGWNNNKHRIIHYYPLRLVIVFGYARPDVLRPALSHPCS